MVGGYGMGCVIFNFFLRSYILGFGASLNTLLSQAYGAERYEDFANILNLARVLLSILMVPLLCILYFIEDVMVFSGQQPEIAHQTGSYIQIAMFAALVHLQYDISRKFLIAIKRSNMYAWIPLVS